MNERKQSKQLETNPDIASALKLSASPARRPFWNTDEPLEVNTLEEAEQVLKKLSRNANKLRVEKEIDHLRKERLKLILDQISKMLNEQSAIQREIQRELQKRQRLRMKGDDKFKPPPAMNPFQRMFRMLIIKKILD